MSLLPEGTFNRRLVEGAGEQNRFQWRPSTTSKTTPSKRVRIEALG
ncbi:MAG: hypothetical protein RR614_05055 [Eubacterium sp.]